MSQKTIFQQFLWGCQAENRALRITHWLTAPHLNQKNFFGDISIALVQNSKKLLEKKKISIPQSHMVPSANPLHTDRLITLWHSPLIEQKGDSPTSHLPTITYHTHASHSVWNIQSENFRKKNFFFLRFLH